MIFMAMMAASAVMSAKAGKKAQKSANASAYSSELQGARQEGRSGIESQWVKQKAREQAGKVKQQAAMARGSQIAAFAASGVVIGNGSTRAMIDETMRLAQQDAMAILMDGARGVINSNITGTQARELASAKASSFAAQGESMYRSGMSNALGSMTAIAKYKGT